MKNAMSLKARIRNLAKEKNVAAQVVLQNFMFECLLERISLSSYKNKFVLKGGMLVAAIVGIDTRATMDLDVTLRQLPLSEDALVKAFQEICNLNLGDQVTFNMKKIAPIRQDDVYGGYRISLDAVYDVMTIPLTVDISTGDIITPDAIKYTFSGIFDEHKKFEVWAYNIETVLAEKVETILRRGVFNTRPRDYYDVFVLLKTQSYDKDLFKEALRLTAEHRHSTEQIANISGILFTLKQSDVLKKMWEKYSKQYPYAKNITYDDIMSALKAILLADNS